MQYRPRNRRRSRRRVRWGRLIAVLAGLAVAGGMRRVAPILRRGPLVGEAVAATFGAPLLAWIFGLDLSLHRDTLCVALVGGVLVALYQLGQTVLVVLRKQAWGLPGMVLAAAAARLAARPFVARFGLRGAALSYVLAVLILAAASDTFATLFLRRVAWRSPKPGNKP